MNYDLLDDEFYRLVEKAILTDLWDDLNQRTSDDGSPMTAVMIATDKPCDTCKRKMHKSPIKLDKWYCANCKKYKD